MAWRRPGDKPLSEPMMVSLLTHICVTRPQWVNAIHFVYRITTIKIKRSCDRLILIIGILLPSRHLCIESGPRLHCLFLRFGADRFRATILPFDTWEMALNYDRTSFALIHHEQQTIGPRAYLMGCNVTLLRLAAVSLEYYIIFQFFRLRQCWAPWPVTGRKH